MNISSLFYRLNRFTRVKNLVKSNGKVKWNGKNEIKSCFGFNNPSKLLKINSNFGDSIRFFHSSSKNKNGREERGRRKSKEVKKEESKSDKNTSIAILVLTVIVGLIGLSYASVPLYRMFCEATGYGGAVNEKKRGVATLKERRNDSNLNAEDRPITIYFNADSNSSVQWKFTPQQRQVTIIPGESALAFYKAKNTTNEPIIGVATYNIAPSKAASYFNKIQCFCFEEQRLEPGEEIDLPVFFYLDPAFLEDPSMRSVTEMTLSYTFFKSRSN